MGIGLIKGSTLVSLNGEATAATGTIQIINNTFDANDAVVINGVSFEESVDWSAGGSIALSTVALRAAINDSNDFRVNGILRATDDSVDTITLTADVPGPEGNAITLTEVDGGTDNFTLSGSVLSGGVLTEGTAVAPSAGSDFIQVEEDGLEFTPAKELVERTTLTSSIGKISPRASTKSGSGSLPIEFRGSGIEGGVPEYNEAILSLLGNRRRLNNRITTGTTHTTTVLNITAADTIFKQGDFIVILESGDHHSAFVTSVASGAITFAPAAANAPSDAVVLAKTVTYFPANVDHLPYTTNIYWGDEILEQAIGARSATMAVENFTTGQIPKLTFGFESLSFNEADGTAAFTPSFDAVLPPLALNVNVAIDGSCLDLNEITLSVENTLGFLTSVKSTDGRISSRVTQRAVSLTLNPYKDDTSVDFFTKFNNNTLFPVIVTAQNSSAVSGEFDLGSCFGLYMPNCLLTEKVVADADGVLVETLTLSANRGTDGLTDELFVSYC